MCSLSYCQKLFASSYVQAAAWLFCCSFSIDFLYFPFYVSIFLVFFVSYYLSAMMLFDLEEEIFVDGSRPSTALIWLSAVPFLQQSLNSGCSLSGLGLFIEFFSISYYLVRLLERSGLFTVPLRS
jgi:hypothetical protein